MNHNELQTKIDSLKVEQRIIEQEQEKIERQKSMDEWKALENHELMVSIKEFESLQCKLSEFGASDSEPTQTLYQIMIDAYNGIGFRFLSARKWELFSTVKGVGDAARQLNEAIKPIAKYIKKNRKNANVTRIVGGHVGTWALRS